MRNSFLDENLEDLDLANLRRMAGPDEHRPGTAYARLLKEQVPAWAIIGHAQAIVEAIDSETTNDDMGSRVAADYDEIVTRVAADYDIRREAVHAAFLYCDEHRCAIDALLEASAAAIA